MATGGGSMGGTVLVVEDDADIVKFPFWQAVERNPRAAYACVNLGEAVAPSAIERRSVLVDADIASTLRALLAS